MWCTSLPADIGRTIWLHWYYPFVLQEFQRSNYSIRYAYRDTYFVTLIEGMARTYTAELLPNGARRWCPVQIVFERIRLI